MYMPTEIKVTPGQGLQVREKGVFNFDKMYKELRAWFDDNRYDLDERVHTQKHKDKGKEIVIKWITERKVTDYIIYYIDVAFLLQEINPVSDELVKGFAKITFTARLGLDYKEQWNKTAFSNFLHKMYSKYIEKAFIEKHWDRLSGEVNELHDIATKIFDFNK